MVEKFTLIELCLFKQNKGRKCIESIETNKCKYCKKDRGNAKMVYISISTDIQHFRQNFKIDRVMKALRLQIRGYGYFLMRRSKF